MKKWATIGKFRIKNLELRIKELVKVLLENRGIKTKTELEEFFNPKLENVTIESVGIDKKELKKAINRIKKAIEKKEQIVVFGDYDVDGVAGTAILWETLHSLSAKVMPYIPHRVDEGYGLSVKGIQNLKETEILKPASRGEQVQDDNKKKGLIITIDNGIVANEAVECAKEQGIDVIITDHHVPSKAKPKAFAIIHTTKICGAGVAYLLSEEILNSNPPAGGQIPNKSQIQNTCLELVALATVADMVPLKGANRTLLKVGLERLKETKRIGLLELFKESGIEQGKIDVYTIGHIIAPRLNAAGRLEYAMDALRLLCTKDRVRAKSLAAKLGEINRERQSLTEETFEDAKIQFLIFKSKINSKSQIPNLLFISNETYQQGVIGLVAGKLVEEFYRPAIVVSKGEIYSKASARSIHGFNIIEFIRSSSELLIDCGGHPMAAGFTVETAKLGLLQKALEEKILDLLTQDSFVRTLRIDCELLLEVVNFELYDAILKLEPFGVGNPQPTFCSHNVLIEGIRVVGKDGGHLRFKFRIQNLEFRIDGIGFGLGERVKEFYVGDKVDIVYTIDQDEWGGNKKLQLKIKDIKPFQI